MSRALAVLLLVSAGYVKAATPADVDFRVLLDGKDIGRHSYHFSPDDAGYVMTSTAKYRVKILGLTVYHYQHRSTEKWSDSCLLDIDSRTDDDGDELRVTSTLTDAGLIIQGDKAAPSAIPCARSFAYWQPGLLQTGVLINSQNGESVSVEVSKTTLSEDKSEVRVTGDELDIFLTYKGTRWIALRTEVAGGRLLEYQLTNLAEE